MRKVEIPEKKVEPELSAVGIPKESPQEIARSMLVGWLFLIGSLVFMLDAILENLKGISLSSLLHLSASLIFTIGSALLIPNPSKSDS